MPYMSLSLLDAESQEKAIEHRLSHDLESLFLVLLHIVGFLADPGTINNVETSSFRVSRWHFEQFPAILKEYKENDLRAIYQEPESFLSQYWCPLAPYLQRLFRVVYSNIDTAFNMMDTTSLTSHAFISILTEARNEFAKYGEKESSYAKLPVAPPKRRSPPANINATGQPKKSRLTSAEGDSERMHPRRARAIPFADWEDSARER